MLLRARFDGEAFRPLDKFMPEVRRTYATGSLVVIDADYPENMAANRAYHAEIRALWQNLPETLDVHYPRPDHLRKRALIKTGYYTANSVALKTAEEARVVAGIMKPLDEFSVVIVRDNVIRIFRPRSQRLRHNDEDAVKMDADELRQSRKDVLEFCRKIVGVNAAEARRHLDFG